MPSVAGILAKNHQPSKIPVPRSSGLARSFCRLPHDPRFVVFFCHTFCNQPFFQSDVFSEPLFQSTLKKQKDAQKKTNSKLLYITCSSIRALAWRQINRDKYNLIMYNSRTKSTLLPRCAARRISPCGRAESLLYLICELFRHTANPKLMPRKTRYNSYACLFYGKHKSYNRFSIIGDSGYKQWKSQPLFMRGIYRFSFFVFVFGTLCNIMWITFVIEVLSYKKKKR